MRPPAHARTPAHATGGLPSYVAGYIYITCYRDVWFCLVTESGGLVCFVTVGGVYVYAGDCMTMCIGFFPPLFETHVCLFLGAGQLLGGQPFALYVGALIDCLVG
jgi:hypothetical protein